MTVSQDLPTDIDALLAQRFSVDIRQAGEVTTMEVVARHHVSIDRARDMLDRMVAEGLATRRKAGRYVYYKVKDGEDGQEDT